MVPEQKQKKLLIQKRVVTAFVVFALVVICFIWHLRAVSPDRNRLFSLLAPSSGTSLDLVTRSSSKVTMERDYRYASIRKTVASSTARMEQHSTFPPRQVSSSTDGGSMAIGFHSWGNVPIVPARILPVDSESVGGVVIASTTESDQGNSDNNADLEVFPISTSTFSYHDASSTNDAEERVTLGQAGSGVATGSSNSLLNVCGQ